MASGPSKTDVREPIRSRPEQEGMRATSQPKDERTKSSLRSSFCGKEIAGMMRTLQQHSRAFSLEWVRGAHNDVLRLNEADCRYRHRPRGPGGAARHRALEAGAANLRVVGGWLETSVRRNRETR